MKKLFFALISILSISSVHAGLGETLDQCAARYGFRTGHSAADQVTFVRDHIIITVHFRGDRSIQEDFAPESGGTISEVEILRENSEGSSWEISGETPVATTYIRKDGRAVATVAKEGAELTIAHARIIVKYTASAAAPSAGHQPSSQPPPAPLTQMRHLAHLNSITSDTGPVEVVDPVITGRC